MNEWMNERLQTGQHMFEVKGIDGNKVYILYKVCLFWKI